MTPNPLLAASAEQCRACYIAERNRFSMDGKAPYKNPGAKWDGGYDNDGKLHKSIWPKIAEFMIKYKLDPAICIMLRFDMARRSGTSKPPMPNQIALEKYLELYRSGLAEQDRNVAAIRTSEVAAFRAQLAFWMQHPGMTPKDAYNLVLNDLDLFVSPLTRYCSAVSLNLPAIAELFYDRAMVQYMSAPDAYDNVWRGHIPHEFVLRARALRAELGGQDKNA